MFTTFAIGVLFFLSGSEQGSTDSFMPVPKEARGVIVDNKALDPSRNKISTEEIVREYFADTPILAEIAGCESRFRHYDKNGDVIRGELTPKDVGVMQINEYYHGKTVDILGYNIYTLEGNMAYAKWLYEQEGTTPWNSSKYCWGKKQLAMTL